MRTADSQTQNVTVEIIQSSVSVMGPAVNPHKTLLASLGVLGCLLSLHYLLTEPGPGARTTEILEARLDQERDILQAACARLRSLDEVIDSGGLGFLGPKRSSLEELVVVGRSLACVSANKTEVILGKIIRLEQTGEYRRCMRDQECEVILPALRDIENHFEARFSLIEDLKVNEKQIGALIPTSSENYRDFNEASSFINNVYICADFIFYEIPSLYKLILNTEAGDPPTAVQNLVSIIIQIGFQMILMTTLFVIVPKTIWKLHLFLMKAVIMFSVLVLCVGFYNYCATFILSLQFRQLRGQIEQNSLAINYVRFTKNIWSVEQIKAAKIQRNIDSLHHSSQPGHGKKMKLDLEQEQELELTDQFAEKFKYKLRELEELHSNEYKDFVIDTRIALEKFQPLMASTVDTIGQYLAIIKYGRTKLLEVTNKTEEVSLVLQIIPNLLIFEEDISNTKLKLDTQIKKMNKIEREIDSFEETNGQTVKRAGTLGALLGAVSAPYLGSHSLAPPSALGVAGSLCAHTASLARSSVLTSVRRVTGNVKSLAKQVLRALDSVDDMKLRSSLVAVDEMIFAGREDESNYYFDETLDMLIENEAETQMSLGILRHAIELI